MTDTSGSRNDGQSRAPSVESPAPVVAYVPPHAAYGEEEIDLTELWHILVPQKLIILLSVLVTTLAAVAYAYLTTPVYVAEVLLAPMSDEKGGGQLASLMGAYGGLASLAGIDISGGNDTVQVALATLKSRTFTKEFIADNDLMPILFEDAWNEEAGTWLATDLDSVPSDGDAYALFDGRVRSVSLDRSTGLVTLSVEWKDPVLAARWANDLVARVNAHRQREAIAEARQSIAYLNQQLGETNVVEMQQAIYRLIEAQTKTIMLANVRQEYAFKVIDPAVAPDRDNFAKPQRRLAIALGLVGGLVLGILSAFLRHFIQAQMSNSKESNAVDERLLERGE